MRKEASWLKIVVCLMYNNALSALLMQQLPCLDLRIFIPIYIYPIVVAQYFPIEKYIPARGCF